MNALDADLQAVLEGQDRAKRRLRDSLLWHINRAVAIVGQAVAEFQDLDGPVLNLYYVAREPLRDSGDAEWVEAWDDLADQIDNGSRDWQEPTHRALRMQQFGAIMDALYRAGITSSRGMDVEDLTPHFPEEYEASGE